MFSKSRFKDELPIKGTQQFHTSIPKTTSKLLAKHFSDVVQSWEREVNKSPDKHKLKDISGYVPAVHYKNWRIFTILISICKRYC